MGQNVSHAGPPRWWRRRRWLQDGLLALALPLSVGAGRALLAPSSRSSLERLEGAQQRLLGQCWEVSCPLLVPPGPGGSGRAWASTSGFCAVVFSPFQPWRCPSCRLSFLGLRVPGVPEAGPGVLFGPPGHTAAPAPQGVGAGRGSPRTPWHFWSGRRRVKSLGSSGDLEQLVGGTGLLPGCACWALSRPLLWAGCDGGIPLPPLFLLPPSGQQGSAGLCPGAALHLRCSHGQDPCALQSSKCLPGTAALLPPCPRQGSPAMPVTPSSHCKSPGGDVGCPCPLHSPSRLFSPWGSCGVWHSSPLPSRVQGPRDGCGGVPGWGQDVWLQSRVWVVQCSGKPCPWKRLWATLCSAAAGVLYAAAIVTHDQQPAHVLRALPWLLIALGSAALDMAVSFPSSSLGALGWDVEVDVARLLSWSPCLGCGTGMGRGLCCRSRNTLNGGSAPVHRLHGQEPDEAAACTRGGWRLGIPGWRGRGR